MPAPPRMSRHSRAMSIAMRQLFHLASETWVGCMLAGILQAAQLQRQQLRGGDAAGHVGQLQLHRLVRRQRTAEQHALGGVVEHFLQAGLRGADRAPGDAVARLGQAAQRTLQALHVGQAGAVRHAHVVEEQRAGDRGAQAHLLVDFLRLEAGRCRWAR